MQYATAIHGGVGTILKSPMTPESESAYTYSLRDAIVVGETILRDAGSSLGAVESAVRELKNNPLFNAGRGSVFNSAGKSKMDACIMNGVDRTDIFTAIYK